MLFSLIQVCKIEAARYETYASITEMYINDHSLTYQQLDVPSDWLMSLP